MKQIIDGKRYDTDTAEWLATLPDGADSRTDFRYEVTKIYRTKNGRFFIAGCGGPLSRWARSVGNNGSTGGQGVAPITTAEARNMLERCGSDGAEALEKYFSIEDA